MAEECLLMLLLTWVNLSTCYSCVCVVCVCVCVCVCARARVCVLYVNLLLVIADDEDQAAELSRLLDQKAYLEELNKELDYVIYI